MIGAELGPGGLLDAEARGSRWQGRWKQCTKTSHLRSPTVMGRGSRQKAVSLRKLLEHGRLAHEEEEAERPRN